MVLKTNNLASSIHMARSMVYAKSIKVGNQKVNIPSYMVKVKNQNKISLVSNSAISGDKPGRTKKMKAKKAEKK